MILILITTFVNKLKENQINIFFRAALKLLKADLTEISKEATVDPKYILLYFYYGALILTAVKVQSNLRITDTSE